MRLSNLLEFSNEGWRFRFGQIVCCMHGKARDFHQFTWQSYGLMMSAEERQVVQISVEQGISDHRRRGVWADRMTER